MRTALVSDLHGNAVALETVVADLAHASADQVVCLGDAVQGGPEPTRTVRRLRELAWPVVRGNADAFVVDPATAEASPEPVTESHLVQREWTVARLDADDLAWLAALPETVECELGSERTLLACHGSPRSYDDVLLPGTPEPEFRAYLDGARADIVAGGHVHLQFLRRLGATLFVNPGSAGLSYDHEQEEDAVRLDPWAAYAVVTTDGEALAVEFRRVPLDVDAIVAAYHASDPPDAELWISRWQGRGAGV